MNRGGVLGAVVMAARGACLLLCLVGCQNGAKSFCWRETRKEERVGDRVVITEDKGPDSIGISLVVATGVSILTGVSDPVTVAILVNGLRPLEAGITSLLATPKTLVDNTTTKTATAERIR